MIELKIVNDKIMEYGIPKYSKPGDAGMDLVSCWHEPLYIPYGHVVTVPTGIAIHIKDENLVGLIFPRSGLATKFGIDLANCVGVIDAHYQGEIKVCLRRLSVSCPHQIDPGDRVAQIVFMPIHRAQFDVVQEFRATSERGEGGFGSTGD